MHANIYGNLYNVDKNSQSSKEYTFIRQIENKMALISTNKTASSKHRNFSHFGIKPYDFLYEELWEATFQ